NPARATNRESVRGDHQGGCLLSAAARSVCVDEAHRLVRTPPTPVDLVPNPDRRPVIAPRNVDDPNIPCDLPPPVASDGPVGMIDFDRTRVDDLGYQGDMAVAHPPRAIEYEHGARFRQTSAVIMPDRRPPPLPSIAG